MNAASAIQSVQNGLNGGDPGDKGAAQQRDRGKSESIQFDLQPRIK